MPNGFGAKSVARPSSHTAARRLAHQVLTSSLPGQLTVIDGAALRGIGGWSPLGAALSQEIESGRFALLVCEMGGRVDIRPHPLSVNLTGDGVCGFLDWDLDLRLPQPNWYDPEADWDEDRPTELPSQLEGFGNPSITAIARTLADENTTDGRRPLLLVEVANARPDREILRRQAQLADPAARDAARQGTFDWLATNLAVFAAFRPTEPTIIALEGNAPEWGALINHAALILPRPHLQAR